MARTYGRRYPERALMNEISDLLQVRHFTTSRGSTVRRDFLEAVARELGVEPEQLVQLKKDEVLALVVELATGKPADASTFSRGTTVKNEVLQQIVDGIVENDLHVRPGGTESEAVATPNATDVGVVAARRRQLLLALVREGQSRFRRELLEAYGQRCAVTGANAVEALDAAHIRPYLGPSDNVVSNGLLLRTDIHRLFDRGAIAVDEKAMRLVLRESLLVTTYADLAGRAVQIPRLKRHRPDPNLLRQHREWAGL